MTARAGSAGPGSSFSFDEGVAKYRAARESGNRVAAKFYGIALSYAFGLDGDALKAGNADTVHAAIEPFLREFGS